MTEGGDRMAQDAKAPLTETEIGFVDHYFSHIQVAAVKITKGDLKPGDTIHVKGHTSDFVQKVDSIQVDKKPVAEAKKGDDIGIKVKEHARENDTVYKVKV